MITIHRRQNTLLTTVLFSFALSCGSSTPGSSGGDNNNKGKVDTSEFVNTAKNGDIAEKTEKVDEIYGVFEDKVGSVAGTTAEANTLGLLRTRPRPRARSYGTGSFDYAACYDDAVSEVSEIVGAVETTTYSCEVIDSTTSSVRICQVEQAKEPSYIRYKATCLDGNSNSTRYEEKIPHARLRPVVEKGENGMDLKRNAGIDASVFEDLSQELVSCGQAFSAIKKFYAASRDELNRMAKDIESAKSLSTDGIKFTEVKNDNAAIAYEFSPEKQLNGFDVSGQVSAAANDDMLIIDLKMDMNIDFSQITNIESGNDLDLAKFSLQNRSKNALEGMKVEFELSKRIEADLKNSAIDFESAGTSHFTMGDKIIESSWKSVVSVAGGEFPSIDYSVQVSQAGAEQSSFQMNMVVALKDENTIEISGNATKGDESKTYQIAMVKNQEGICAIQDEGAQ